MLQKFKNLFIRFINHMREQYTNLNPYLDHINLFIYYNIIPYKNIEDLKAGKCNCKKLFKIAAYIAIIFVDLFRLLGIVLNDNHLAISVYFFVFFENQPNHEYIFTTIFLLFLIPTIFCNYLATIVISLH